MSTATVTAEPAFPVASPTAQACAPSNLDLATLTPETPLPDHVPTLHGLIRQLLAVVAQQRSEIAELRAKVDAALRHRFGQRSERRVIPPLKTKPKPGQATPHGRNPLPDHLERRIVTHDLTLAEKRCPCCGQPRACIGEQATEQLDMEPVRFFVRKTVKKKYACQHCDAQEVPTEQRFQTAGPAEVGPIARGLCGPGLLAHTITAKYADHTPLHRLAGQLGRSGVTLSCSTLGDWMAAAAALLMPLVVLMKARIRLSRVIHGDDTPVKLRVPGQKKTSKAHLWVYIGDADYPYVVFAFTVDYTATGPEEFLQGYKGYLQADALAQYECLYGPGWVLHVCCMAHARRKFVVAAEGGEERADRALELIGQLYAIEWELPPLLPPSDDEQEQQQRRQREEQRRLARARQSQPVLDALKQWLDEHKDKALPKSKLGQAIGYALNNWTALCRYVEQGYLAIDNNLSERTLRLIAMGRNNWGVFGSAAGGETAAVLFTLTGTCKHLGIDPFAYLRELLPALFALGEKPTEDQLQPWLPDEWLRRRQAAAPQLAATG
jgi:transposase